MDPIRPIGPRPDLAPVRPVVLPPHEREQRRREREERQRERDERRGRGDETASEGDEPPRLDVRA
jgi:hypothetical protein